MTLETFLFFPVLEAFIRRWGNRPWFLAHVYIIEFQIIVAIVS